MHPGHHAIGVDIETKKRIFEEVRNRNLPSANALFRKMFGMKPPRSRGRIKRKIAKV